MSTYNFLPNTHTSEDTAYTIADYPYGFNQRTTAKMWVESKPGKGARSMFQTLNPKTQKWNKPKASTYSLFVRLYLDDKDHVHAYHFNPYSVEEYEQHIQNGVFDNLDIPFEHARHMHNCIIGNISWLLGAYGLKLTEEQHKGLMMKEYSITKEIYAQIKEQTKDLPNPYSVRSI